MSFFSLLIATLFGGCSKANLSPADVAGTWLSSDGAELHFEDDGRFSSRNLPGGILFGPRREGERHGGSGTWTLQKGSAGMEVQLVFDSIADRRSGFGIPIFVSGSGPSLRLFFWQEEEGGARYEFSKKP